MTRIVAIPLKKESIVSSRRLSVPEKSTPLRKPLKRAISTQTHPSKTPDRVSLKSLMQRSLLESPGQAWKPKPHHKLGMRHLLENACAGLFADPGLGKTSITLGAVKILKQQKMLRGVLVIAPLRPCYLVWPKEQRKWTDFHKLRIQVLHGAGKQNLEAADIYVVNPDGLPWMIRTGMLQQLLDNGVDTLVIDESTKFRHTRTKRFKLLKPFLNSFRRRWILTGTPTPKSYLDLFGQIYILDLGAALGQYITHFRFNYFFPTGYGGYTWILKEGGEEAIQERIQPYILRLEESKKDPPTENVIRVELPDEVRKLYNDMEDDMVATLQHGPSVVAKNAAVASAKCAQIANGGIYYRETPGDLLGIKSLDDLPASVRLTQHLHTEKVDALGELVEQLQGSPALVAYDYGHDLERLTKAFPRAEVMGGGTSMTDTVRIEAAWNRGEIDMLLAHPQAMGHGLNLQEGPGHTVVWHSLTWDYELYDQFIRRVWRTGQRQHVYVHHIIVRDTVDEVKLQAMRGKRRTQDTLLTALRLYAETRQKARRKSL